jgi:hypothetical protein
LQPQGSLDENCQHGLGRKISRALLSASHKSRIFLAAPTRKKALSLAKAISTGFKTRRGGREVEERRTRGLAASPTPLTRWAGRLSVTTTSRIRVQARAPA